MSQVGGTERLQAGLDDLVDELVKQFLEKSGVAKADRTFILRVRLFFVCFLSPQSSVDLPPVCE